jgi:hypothetical protein
MTDYTITERREVPAEIRSVGAITRRVVVETPAHASSKAVCVKTSTGFMAWGFGACWATAEADAVSKAARIAA